jgi:ABC-type multidrug transport system fused ATPase/permease subunit
VATVGLAIYGAYKLGEWVVGAIRESTKGKDDEEETKRTTIAVGGAVVACPRTSPSPSPAPPGPPCLDRETQRKLERHLKSTCARDSLALMQRMAPALYESIAERTSIANERHELKRLRGDTTSTQRQQVLWRDIQNKTLLRFLLTMLAESLLFTVTWLHIHWVTASSSSSSASTSSITAPLLSTSQTSTLFRTLFNTILSFLDIVERQCQAAITQHTHEWDTHSDAALHMTYAKLKAGLDHCIAGIMSMNSSSDQNDNKKLDLWMHYVASLEREFGELAATKDTAAGAAELLDLMESPLAKEVFPALFQTLYVDNAVRNLQQVFSTKGELPLAQVIAKLSKQSFAQDEQLDRLVGLAEVQRISQIFFPED